MNDVKLKLLNENPPKDSVILFATDTPRYFWNLECLVGTKLLWEVYIAVNQNRILPTLFENKQDTLFVGVEQGIFVIKINTGDIINNVTDTTYVQSIELISGEFVLILSEDELICFDSKGDILWRTNFPDIIEDIEEIEEGLIKITDLSGGIYRLNVKTGKSAVEQSNLS